MGARRETPSRDSFAARFGANDGVPVPPPPPTEEVLPLDKEELDMLAIFHKSFNLPGLRHGLVRPVLDTDYFPEEEEEAVDEQSPSGRAAARAPRPRYEEPDAVEELKELLARTRGLQLEVNADATLSSIHVLAHACACHHEQVDDALATDAPTVDDEIDEAIESAVDQQSTASRPVHGSHQRQMRSVRPMSASRPPSSGLRPPSGGATANARPRRW